MLLKKYKSVGSLSADSCVKPRDVSYWHELEIPAGYCHFWQGWRRGHQLRLEAHQKIRLDRRARFLGRIWKLILRLSLDLRASKINWPYKASMFLVTLSSSQRHQKHCGCLLAWQDQWRRLVQDLYIRLKSFLRRGTSCSLMIDLEADWSPILCKLRRCVLQSSIHIFENPNAWTQRTTQVAKSAQFCLQVIDVRDYLTLTGLRKQNSPDCTFKEDTQEATWHVKQGTFSFSQPLIVIKDQSIENVAFKPHF